MTMSILLYGCTTWILAKCIEKKKKTRWELHKNSMCYFEQIMEAAPHKTAVVYVIYSAVSL